VPNGKGKKGQKVLQYYSGKKPSVKEKKKGAPPARSGKDGHKPNGGRDSVGEREASLL